MLLEVLKQDQYDTYDVNREIIELFAAKHRYLEDIEKAKIKPLLNDLYSYIKSTHKEILDELTIKKEFSVELTKNLKVVIEEFLKVNK